MLDPLGNTCQPILTRQFGEQDKNEDGDQRLAHAQRMARINQSAEKGIQTA